MWRRVALAILFSAPLIPEAQSADVPVAAVAPSTQIAGWWASHAMDGSPGSVWSSVTARSNHRQWFAYWFDNWYPINYIKLRPRFGATALGFPRTFGIHYSDGYTWQLSYTRTNFPTPTRDGWIILPLASTVVTEGISIDATVLGMDDVGNYVFQLAKVGAGYDPALEHFRYLGNNGASYSADIQSVGSSSFDPSKTANWAHDVRRPLIAAKPCSPYSPLPAHRCRNIYAPSVVKKNASQWNVYFGGADGGSTGYVDQISVVATTDNFQTFWPHALQITNGQFAAVNNPSVIKLSDTDWRMYYTTLEPVLPMINKPAVAYSSNGESWTPSSGYGGYRINMAGLPTWLSIDVNGSNVIHYENGLFYLYFYDIRQSQPNQPADTLWGIPYATSPDGMNFTYQGLASNQSLITNDFKKFVSSSGTHYVTAYHVNGGAIYYSVGTSLTQFPAASTLLESKDADDAVITSAGFVADGNRLYGVLYGASPLSSPEWGHAQAIYAAWLQKKVTFGNAYVLWGDGADKWSRGPDTAVLKMTTPVETGQFTVTDLDDDTSLLTTPQITIQQGDVWRYEP